MQHSSQEEVRDKLLTVQGIRLASRAPTQHQQSQGGRERKRERENERERERERERWMVLGWGVWKGRVAAQK